MYDPKNDETGLNPQNVFEKIVVGSSNRKVIATTLLVIEKPGQRGFNPFVVYGGVGLGKAELLQSAGNHFLKTHLGRKVRYVTTSQFLTEWENALSRDNLPQFRAKFLSLDFLLFDEFQLLLFNRAAQEEIFFIFDEFVKASKQIIIGSDRPPRAMLELNGSLKAILENGIVADIQLPDYDMRLSLLKSIWEKQAFSSSLFMPSEVLEFIAHKIVSNFRQLEAALVRVANYAIENQTELNLYTATQALADSIISSKKKSVSFTQIMEEVAQFFGIEQEELRGKGRSLNIVLPRQIAMYLLREQTEASLKEIGLALGKRSPTTVSHSIAKIEAELEQNRSLRQYINTIVQLLYSRSE
jgi:chromosomal replication initiator protein